MQANGKKIRFSVRTIGLLFFTAWLGSATGLAQSSDLTVRLQSSPKGIWQDEIGSGFQKNVIQTGFNLGAGMGVTAFGTTVAHDLALASVNVGWMFSGVVAKDHWWAGNWELSGELFAGSQINPDYRYLVGLTPLVRYNFVTDSRWVPFLDAGVGILGTDIGHPDLGGTLQFSTQIGIGTHYFLRRDLALTLEARGLHISDAGIKKPNDGVNTPMFYLGLNWFF